MRYSFDVDSLKSMNEAMDAVNDSLDNIENQSVEDVPNPPMSTEDSNPEGNEGSEEELLDQLNKIFTPILVMQKYEGDMSDQIQETLSEAAVLTEQNIIKFDDSTRMAQLISTCALLIARQKNSEKYQMYQKAATIRNKMKLDIQKEEYEAAKALAQKFLVKVSTTNNSSVARNAANELLPETQH